MPRVESGDGAVIQPSKVPKKARCGPKVRRTPRACDRCRFKKTKCDGQQPCKNCEVNDRTCIYSVMRRRDARIWYCGMQEMVDEALQRLYRSCKGAGCFPGILPNEQDGVVTTENILRGMGFATLPVPNGQLDIPQIRDDSRTTDKVSQPRKDSSASIDTSYTENETQQNSGDAGKSDQTSERSYSVPSRRESSTQYTPSLTTEISLDMCDQFHAALAHHKDLSSVSTKSIPTPVTPKLTLPHAQASGSKSAPPVDTLPWNLVNSHYDWDLDAIMSDYQDPVFYDLDLNDENSIEQDFWQSPKQLENPEGFSLGWSVEKCR